MKQTPPPRDRSFIRILPASPERWQDIQALFDHTPCWCQYWRQTSSEYGRRPKEQLIEHWMAERREALHHQLSASVPPGMLAYLDGVIAGWCGIGVRQEMGRLERSRTIPKVDDRPVWSIVCFLVRPGYRRKGVAQALLHGVIEYAREQGAPALEAYPVDLGGLPGVKPGKKRIDTASAYVGVVSMFEREGFQRVVETASRSAGFPRWLVRLELEENPAGRSSADASLPGA